MRSSRAVSELTVRAITDAELPAVMGCVLDVFGTDPAVDPQVLERMRVLVPVPRTFAAFDGSALVATASAYSLALTVCGGAVVPTGGLTIVTVRPTHRRRGLLRRLINAHLDDCRARGEALSGLYASEGGIYGRFGYGVAVESDELAVVAGDGLIESDDGAVGGVWPVGLSDDEALATLPAIYAAACAQRPGMYARSLDWWRWRRIADRPFARRGRSPRRHVVVRKAGVDRGYVVYRQQLAFEDGRPAGAVDVEELVALDADAEAALWRHVTTLDLFPRVSVANAAVDCPLPWLASDYRRVVRRRRFDTLWLRIDDVTAALGARRYAADGAVTFVMEGGGWPHDVEPQSRWRLVVEDGVGTCVPAVGGVDVTLDRATLSSLYLGGVRATALAQGGRITGKAEAIAQLDRMFAWPVAPWCAEQF
ncbi:MAG: GNAT family N-acetyltransferase [Myxococcales bacterium]|nr:GNAT family N-acetyltransferase [Myxococcales bacterium]MBK7193518.1 GNAT family N-acetyltransferase [Myxococcales bacterium]MBP6844144.1 GNAT family N-acetyltransferase [Kofleriaceae bacterium]